MTARPAAARHGSPWWRSRLVVVLGIVLVSLNLRTAVTSISPLLVDIDRDLGLGVSGIGLLGMVPTAMFAAWGLATPPLIRRFGPERLAVAAMMAAAAGQVIRALAGDPWMIGAGSVVALSGMGIGNVVAPPLVKKYFPDRVPEMSMLYITGLQLGTVVPALAAVPLADVAGWRASIGLWSVLALVATVPWILGPLRSGQQARASELTGTSPATSGTGHPKIQVWRSPVGIAIALFFGANSLCTYAFFTWLPAVVQSIGMSKAEAGVALAVFSAFGLVAGIAVPWIAGRVQDPYPVVLLSIASYLAGFAGLLWAPQTATWLWIVLLGMGPSTFALCLTLINLRTRTAAGSAALSGFSQGVGYSAACLGPVVFGQLFQSSGLAAGFGFLTVVLAVMAVVSRQACRPRMLEDASWRSR